MITCLSFSLQPIPILKLIRDPRTGGEFVFEPVPQHRIRRKPIQMIQDQHYDRFQSTPPHSPIPIQPTPTKVSKPTRAFLQSQILINFANHVNQTHNDPNTSSTASTATARSNFSTFSDASTIKNSVCTATSASYSVWSENGPEDGRQQNKPKFQCRFVHRMRSVFFSWFINPWSTQSFFNENIEDLLPPFSFFLGFQIYAWSCVVSGCT